jgi:hypothetical protein
MTNAMSNVSSKKISGVEKKASTTRGHRRNKRKAILNQAGMKYRASWFSGTGESMPKMDAHVQKMLDDVK